MKFIKVLLKVVFLILFAIWGYFDFVKPVVESNNSLELEYRDITLTYNPEIIESRISGKTRTVKYYTLKAEELPLIEFYLSVKHCHSDILKLKRNDKVRIGTEKGELTGRYNQTEKVTILELVSISNTQEVILLDKSIEVERREGWNSFIYPFSIILILLLAISLFHQDDKT